MSFRRIADIVNRSVGTISNEVKTGTGKRNGSRDRMPEYSAKRNKRTMKSIVIDTTKIIK